MRVSFLCGALLVTTNFPSAVAGEAHGITARRVLVLPLASLGVDEAEAASLLGSLRAEVSRLPGVSLVQAVKIVGADCEGDEKCLAAAGAKTKADKVIAGTVAAVGEAYSIDLKVISVRSGREEDRVTEVLSGERQVLIEGIRGMAYHLLLPSEYVGAIQLELPEPGAEVFVDGSRVGVTPLDGPIANLAPGKRALHIVKPGAVDFNRWVEVRFQRVSRVRVELESNEMVELMFEKQPSPATGTNQPTTKRILTSRRIGALVAGGLGLGAVGAGFYFGYESRSSRNALLGLATPNGGIKRGNLAKAVRDNDSMRSNATAANVCWGAGATVVVGALVLWLTGGEATPALSVASTGRTVVVIGKF